MKNSSDGPPKKDGRSTTPPASATGAISTAAAGAPLAPLAPLARAESDAPQSMTAPTPVHVLVVEDDDVEIMAMERALKSAKIPYTMSVARDGVEALAALRGDGEKAALRPDIVFLDLNMPRMNGLEFLKEVRQCPEYSDLNVVVVTTSNAEEDRRAALQCRVSGYVVKSDYVGNFRAFAGEIESHVKTTVYQSDGRGPQSALIVSDGVWAKTICETIGEGIEIQLVGTIDDVWSVLKEREFDVVIVDARSSEEVIHHTLEAAQDKNLLVPFLFIAESQNDELISRAVRGGADAVLVGTDGLRALRSTLISAFERGRSRRALVEAINRLEQLACVDPLTEVLNRRGFERVLQAELARALRQGSQLMVLLADCESFKVVNDTYGHAAGDAVLQEVSNRIRATLRRSDHVARIGGDEFLVLLPDVSAAEAEVLADRVRAAVAVTPIIAGSASVWQQVSAVVYPVPREAQTVTEVLQRAVGSLNGRRRSKRVRAAT